MTNLFYSVHLNDVDINLFLNKGNGYDGSE